MVSINQWNQINPKPLNCCKSLSALHHMAIAQSLWCEAFVGPDIIQTLQLIQGLPDGVEAFVVYT